MLSHKMIRRPEPWNVLRAHDANLRGSTLEHTSFSNANMKDADLGRQRLDRRKSKPLRPDIRTRAP
jgi:hypothetical protein